MILPSKHIRFAESLFGLGGYLLSLLSEPKTVDHLWREFERVNNTKEYPANHSFDSFLLTLEYLYLIGAIGLDEMGRLYHEVN